LRVRSTFIPGSILDGGENSCDGAAEEIDAVNDETFGEDFEASINSELEDYAAQTACLRLDDGETWENPSCSKPPAPDASNVPLPYFDIFGTPSFSSVGSETMLHSLERHQLTLATPIGGVYNSNDIPSNAVNATDLERRFIEEAASVSAAGNRRSTPSIQQPPAVMPPAYGGVPPMQLPPILPPVHPMMLPLVPVWLEHLAGRTRYLPPGCPPIPPLLRLLFNTVKDPLIVMDMLRTAPGGSVPPPFPPPAKGFERRTPYHRKPPGMPSGRTIEDLAFDQFAGYMSCKEREWLVKIQVLQCQGNGLPCDDDYYYTHWREKQIARSSKSKLVNSAPNMSTEEPKREHELRLRRVNGSRTQFDITKEPKELVPLNVKFAGSLGLPSRSSASNPRHLISVEPSVENADEDAAQRVGKQRKLRTLLLRLESALSLLIECEDIRVRLRNSGQNSEISLSKISQRIDVIFMELMTDDFLKILQIGKGRSVVARSLSAGTPSDVIRIVLKLFSVMSSCPKKCLDDIRCDIIPSMFNGLMGLDREQLVTLSSQLNFASIKENIEGKNTFCRDSLLTTLLACVKQKALSHNMVHWLCSSSGGVDFVDGWSSPISKWRKLLPGMQDSDVQARMAEAIRGFWQSVVETKRAYLNPHEHFGRANICRATFASYFGIYLLFKWNQNRKAKNLRKQQAMERVNILNDALERVRK
uniref:PAT1 domain-containing protein n=1 Tax=Angiostrongylus costaricensis TaxID=334426 RepID=A0A0R3PT61_ANGCS